MRILYIIGNGFDKAQDLKTSAYRSFCRLKKSKCVSMGHFAGW